MEKVERKKSSQTVSGGVLTVIKSFYILGMFAILAPGATTQSSSKMINSRKK
jgi:hypothetical protein